MFIRARVRGVGVMSRVLEGLGEVGVRGVGALDRPWGCGVWSGRGHVDILDDFGVGGFMGMIDDTSMVMVGWRYHMFGGRGREIFL